MTALVVINIIAIMLCLQNRNAYPQLWHLNPRAEIVGGDLDIVVANEYVESGEICASYDVLLSGQR